jgi:hypothetical protein
MTMAGKYGDFKKFGDFYTIPHVNLNSFGPNIGDVRTCRLCGEFMEDGICIKCAKTSNIKKIE